MKRLLGAFAWVGLLLIIGRTQVEDAKKNPEKLQGTWKLIEVVNDGHMMFQKKLKVVQVLFKFNGDEMTIKEGNNDKNSRTFRVTLYQNTNPRAVDLFPLNHNSMGSIIHGIYWLEGNALKFCWPATPGAKERPKKFKSEQGSKIALLTLKRVKS